MVRVAWLADSPYHDSATAREARVILRELSTDVEIEPLWIARGMTAPPHIWHGVRIYPLPYNLENQLDYFVTLFEQIQPQLTVSSFSVDLVPCLLDQRLINKIYFLQDTQSECGNCANHKIEVETQKIESKSNELKIISIPRLFNHSNGGAIHYDPSIVMQLVINQIRNLLLDIETIKVPKTQFVIRQHLFCNTSFSHTTFELTNALLEMGIPTVAQDEWFGFSKEYIKREEEFYRIGSPKKYERIRNSQLVRYDPDCAVTIHHTLFMPDTGFMKNGVFRVLSGREAVYATGNHNVRKEDAKYLSDRFEAILAPSRHVIAPYYEAGLSRRQGFIIPHGIDPDEFSSSITPLKYDTQKSFRFLQTSFPWVREKGFDITIQAFCKAFSKNDEVALIIRVPK